MSNNIYDILKKFNNLDSVKNILSEGKTVKEETGKCNESAKGEKCPVHGMKECAGMYEGKDKPDFLDMDKDGDKKEPMKKAAKEKSKGAVAEAVAQVERQLNEKYMGFKKAAAADKKMVKELDPNLKDPESEWFHSRGQIAPVAAYTNDEQGQKQYKDRTSGGVINKVKDFVGYDKPNPAYGPKDTKVKEGDYNEDMLSPGQKKIARMSPPPDKIDANDLKALRAGKDKKKEGAGVMHYKKEQAKADGKDSFKLGDKEYPVQEGFPTTADSKKRMDDREGKTTHGKKTATKTGMKHERDYDREETGERGRPVKDKFAKKK